MSHFEFLINYLLKHLNQKGEYKVKFYSLDSPSSHATISVQRKFFFIRLGWHPVAAATFLSDSLYILVYDESHLNAIQEAVSTNLSHINVDIDCVTHDVDTGMPLH